MVDCAGIWHYYFLILEQDLCRSHSLDQGMAQPHLTKSNCCTLFLKLIHTILFLFPLTVRMFYIIHQKKNDRGDVLCASPLASRARRYYREWVRSVRTYVRTYVFYIGIVLPAILPSATSCGSISHCVIRQLQRLIFVLSRYSSIRRRVMVSPFSNQFVDCHIRAFRLSSEIRTNNLISIENVWYKYGR